MLGVSPWQTLGSPYRSSSRAYDGIWSMVEGGYNDSQDAIAQVNVAVPSWAETGAVYFAS